MEMVEDFSRFGIFAERVRLTINCRDADPIAKVDNAGELEMRLGEPVQVMHNGIVVAEGCYYGDWMTEIIRRLKGHHEPQEELAFHLIVERLREEGTRGVMVELGSFWAYYSLWFTQRLPEGFACCVEPDPVHLAVGRRNFELNGRDAAHLNAAVGGAARPPAPFTCESDGEERLIPTESLDSLMAHFGIGKIDVLLADVQGAELGLLEGGSELLRSGRIRFLVLSTHHHSISGDMLTHQRCLELLRSLGAHVIAEHTVAESFSGDGLIAVSFEERDSALVAPITYARPGHSLFGDPLVELARVEEERVRLQALVDQSF